MKKINRKTFWIFCLLVLSVLTIYLAVPNRSGQTQESQESVESPGAVFTVTTNADSGAGSFRQAITDANATAGTDTIQFQIGTGAVSINIASDLPLITEAVVIDGTTQPGFSGTPLINLIFNGFITPQGLKLTGGGSTIKAIAVTNGQTGITLENGGNNIITGCFVGIDPQNPTTGGNSQSGILINNSPNNRVGGATTAERNIIGNNTADGIRITGNASSGNIITGNYIGIRAPGALARNNQSAIAIVDAPNNRVGGTTTAERNVLVGSAQGSDLPGNQSKSGVFISGAAASGNAVEGNYIGTDIDGTTAITGGMRFNGVRIENAPNNRVGGTVGTTPGGSCTGACNVIAGVMFRGGVYITGSGATGNTVQGNFIGTNAAGTALIGSGNNVGMTITNGAANNTVGGTASAARNLITNGMILTAGANGNIVQGNYIGTDTTGNAGIGLGTLFPNILVAVGIDSSPNNVIGTVTGTTLGGACTGGCNLISGNNASHGVFITGNGSTGNRVDYNYIGLNAAGTAALRNGGDAITLRGGANNNIIGRPMATITPFQETKQVENNQLTNNICVQSDRTGDYITFKLSSDFRTATYTAVHAKSGESTSGTVDAHLGQPAIGLWGNGLGVFVELATGKASATISFPSPSNLLLSIADRNVGDSACVRQVADNGMQTVVGTVTNGINNDPTPPNNNDYNTNSLGCSADGINNLSNELADGNFICRTCNFTSFTNNTVCTQRENESVIIRDGTDNYIADLDVQRFRDCTSGCPDRFNREIDLHDDNMTNPPVPNPGPGANRSQNYPQNVRVIRLPGGSVLLTATFNSTPNTTFRFNVYHTFAHVGGGYRHYPQEHLDFEQITDGSGNATISKLYTGDDAKQVKYFEDITLTATAINQVPIASENSATSFVDIPGDTSEMSLPAVVPKPQFDFDNDGKTDIAVYRPGATTSAESFWYILNSGDFTFRVVQFGIGEDKIVAGDYQGDGVADFAVFRPSNGTWYHSRLTGNPSTNFVGISWGLSTDIPVPGDYDDDGANDAAVFRPSEGVWYIRRSIDGSVLTNRFGNSTDKPVPADYNGDGQTDFAIYRNGEWWISPCAGCPARVVTFGLATDSPVPGVDFDGDGADDIAVTRNEGGSKIWHWLESGTGNYRAAQFGLSADKVLAGDFDADGKSDLAVFRPSEGNWYVLGSEQGFFAINWGLSSDVPVPSLILP